MSNRSQRLELTWANKDRRLLSHGESTYEWVEAQDYRVAEVRLLENQGTFGDNPADNLLIHGDAMHALSSLINLPDWRSKYLGKVKLCYIDPPFNTGQAFAHYDDAVEHSVWLTLLRDRLLQVKQLLSDDGSVWVHLDDAEAHRARSVMDEVFGADNFIATVIWQKADSPRNSAKYLSVDQDYIHVYAKSAATWRPRKLARTAEADAIYTNPDDDERGPWLPGDPFANKPYSLGTYSVTGPTGRQFSPPPGKFWRISLDRLRELDEAGSVWWGPDGNARPSIKRYLSEVGDLVPRTLWTHKEVGSNRTSSNEMKALFPGAVTFSTPKPEALMKRILEIGSTPGDLVLDCFAGSGTTAATAHKMRRRWIAVELSESNLDTYVRPRLAKVIDGSDRGGISETTTDLFEGDLPEDVAIDDVKAAIRVLSPLMRHGTFNDPPNIPRREAGGPMAAIWHLLTEDPEAHNQLIEHMAKQMRAAAKTRKESISSWDGGGGYTYARVAPSMFDTHEGYIVLSDWAVDRELQQAVCAQLRFAYAPHGPFAGTQGKTRVAVINSLLTASLVDYYYDYLADDEVMVIVAQALEPGVQDYIKSKRKGCRARKIPRDLARLSASTTTIILPGDAS